MSFLSVSMAIMTILLYSKSESSLFLTLWEISVFWVIFLNWSSSFAFIFYLGVLFHLIAAERRSMRSVSESYSWTLSLTISLSMRRSIVKRELFLAAILTVNLLTDKSYNYILYSTTYTQDYNPNISATSPLILIVLADCSIIEAVHIII
jgi:hypothetical protein